VKSHNSLFTVSQLRFFFRYHVCTSKVLINKIVCDHITYSTSIGNSFQPSAHMYTITCGQPESLCLSEKYLRSLEAPRVQNSTWRGKSNASLYLSSLVILIYTGNVKTEIIPVNIYFYLMFIYKHQIKIYVNFCLMLNT